MEKHLCIVIKLNPVGILLSSTLNSREERLCTENYIDPWKISHKIIKFFHEQPFLYLGSSRNLFEDICHFEREQECFCSWSCSFCRRFLLESICLRISTMYLSFHLLLFCTVYYVRNFSFRQLLLFFVEEIPNLQHKLTNEIAVLVSF